MPGAAALLALGYGAYLLGSYAAGTLYYYIHPIYVVPAAVTGALLLALGLLGWRGRGAGPAGTLLLALPLAAGLLLPAQPLGVAAVQQRGMNTAPMGALDDGPSFTVAADPARYTIKDWVKTFHLDPEPTAHAGKPVRVTGFVYRDATSRALSDPSRDSHAPRASPTGDRVAYLAGEADRPPRRAALRGRGGRGGLR